MELGEVQRKLGWMKVSATPSVERVSGRARLGAPADRSGSFLSHMYRAVFDLDIL